MIQVNKVEQAQQVKIIQRSDLPVHCPTSEVPLWNAHPRVYLPILATGQATCPYCGTQFMLG